jgi:hypothetical protein
MRRGCGWHGASTSFGALVMDPMAPSVPSRSMSTNSITSRSHRSNSHVKSKKLQHPPTIIDNEVDGWRLRSTEHHPLTDGASDGPEMEILSRAALNNNSVDPHNHLVCVDAVGGGWMVVVGSGRGGGVVAMVIASFHRGDKSVPNFWHERYVFPRR